MLVGMYETRMQTEKGKVLLEDQGDNLLVVGYIREGKLNVDI